MLDRTRSDLLGSVEDEGAYPAPEAVHRANAKARIRWLRAPNHDNWSPGLAAPASVRASQGSACSRRYISTSFVTSPSLPLFRGRIWRLSIQSTYFGKIPIGPQKKALPLRLIHLPLLQRLVGRMDAQTELRVSSLPRNGVVPKYYVLGWLELMSGQNWRGPGALGRIALLSLSV